MKAPIFLTIPPKFQFQIYYALESRAEIELIIGKIIFDFLMYLHDSLIQSVKCLF